MATPSTDRPIRFQVLRALLFSFGLLFVLSVFAPLANERELAYTEFKSEVAAGRVADVRVSRHTIRGHFRPEPSQAGGPAGEFGSFRTVRVSDPRLLAELEAAGVRVQGATESSIFRDVLPWLGTLLLFLSFPLVLRWMTTRPGGLLAAGQSRARIYAEKDIATRFDDVAGVDEAKIELQEVIEYLRTPEKFRRLGGHVPKGILLVGPPGTGKTLLARAVAGEAGVAFFSISGSEFVEMFVGVGAARVRGLFEQAKAKAPCIIFIDELDAIGKVRGIGPMAHEEREQTLNQLLVELDGFDPRSGVILMAATNRPEILDPALLRAGRFDRHVLVDRPDKAGRLAILRVHARAVSLAPEVDLDAIAAMTPGFVGADLANIVNEATLLAVRRGNDRVETRDLQEAVERVIAGLEKKSRVLNATERQRTAHHELGHALAALSIPGSDEVQKISIIPRGISALGYTIQLPTEDRFLMTRSELENRIAVLLGGRAAEEIVYGEASTGAEDDLLKATAIARSMVKSYGMSEKLGRASLERERHPLFLPGAYSESTGAYSEATAREIDCEVRAILDRQYERVHALLVDRSDAMKAAAARLLECETMSGAELRSILEARPCGERALAAVG